MEKSNHNLVVFFSFRLDLELFWFGFVVDLEL